MRIEIRLNGTAVGDRVEPRELLVEWVRRHGSKGTHVGCDTTSCGACTVLVDGAAVKSCTMLAVQADGAEVVTIEGLGGDGRPSAVQEAFSAEHGLQCGFCTPGFVVAAEALLASVPDPSPVEVIEALEGNLCRCTGYTNIIRAVLHAAALRRGEHPSPEAGRTHETPLARTEVRAGTALEDFGDAEVV